MHLTGTSIGYMLAYCYRNEQKYPWLLMTKFRRAALVTIEILLATVIVYTAISSKTCDAK